MNRDKAFESKEADRTCKEVHRAFKDANRASKEAVKAFKDANMTSEKQLEPYKRHGREWGQRGRIVFLMEIR
jgi:hypothetical protein